jgi:hypothetical protein
MISVDQILTELRRGVDDHTWASFENGSRRHAAGTVGVIVTS